MDEINAELKSKRRWYHFHLWHLMILTVMAAIGCAYLACLGKKIRAFHRVADELREVNAAATCHGWDIVAIDFYHIPDVATCTDSDLERLRTTIEELPNLRSLSFSCVQIGDECLVHLQGLSQLQELRLYNTAITDAGLEHLKGLSCLKHLDLRNTQVTEEGIADLQEALPNCGIYHSSQGRKWGSLGLGGR